MHLGGKLLALRIDEHLIMTGTGDDVDNLSDPAEEEIECEDEAGEPLEDHAPVLRPGIVHRLDKGTTGMSFSGASRCNLFGRRSSTAWPASLISTVL